MIFQVLAVAFAGISAVLAAPTPPPPHGGIPPPDLGPQYFFRCHAPEQPWHQRHLVLLPSSQLLGLENFTVHPTTPPFTFTPIPIPSTPNYAFRAPFAGDDRTATPYLSAISTTASRSSNLGVLPGPDPNHIARCPEQKNCSANAFSVYDGDTGFKRLSLEVFPGAFEAVKDAPNGEGWHVYWRGSGGPTAWDRAIEFDIVPIELLEEK
ncbi:hypothetical protein BU24DRAFT_261911 [Aaosphaeria arxii CBS 175.79]|uniref:Ubiquitin 3 binding protein But2 C-terminal domain-containing protein n=1 Tax=Aaosphaeria arxii CBS 175.79 TaxID=1450172 RepID=A0A6A5XJN1_9PLEO|nr:uncharacterized protein BU24DRAFT_261911 [Aaosphaeria arxii CBS 175.79]KAF2012950.1 hypothetical protein BU24DRAFT_261911 [Aaosphaeria arxii CBS 175.79]